MRSLVFIAIAVIAAGAAYGEVLFPEPLHLRREIADPITGSSSTIDEYCQGNRIVAVHGARVVITDYERREVTEIDHNLPAFSITPFREIPQPAAVTEKRDVKLRPLPQKRSSADGRPLDVYEFAHEAMKIELAVDRSVAVSPAAVEALIGAARPGTRSIVHEVALAAGGLPSEQSITYTVAGESVTFRSHVVAIDRETAPPDLLLIPPGAKRIESKITAVPRILKEIERIP